MLFMIILQLIKVEDCVRSQIFKCSRQSLTSKNKLFLKLNSENDELSVTINEQMKNCNVSITTLKKLTTHVDHIHCKNV